MVELQPFVSVIIPVYNAAQYLDKCIAAVRVSTYSSHEIIVVDDASTDHSPAIARELGATVFRLLRQSGPAAARNYGAQKAQGDILLFVDSDVLIKKDSIALVVDDFMEDRNVSALFGSYDDDPTEKNFLSQYKNLVHHFVHQQGNSDASTFWAGCGAIRRDVFDALGGFDEQKYSRPCIEDIELGYRMKRAGYRILLDKDLQVKHVKKWRLNSLLRTDIFSRAVPWTKLILQSQEMVNDLNLKKSQKISAGLVGIIAVMLPLFFFLPKLVYVSLSFLVIILLINHKLFTFFLTRKGFRFTFLAFAMHLLYYFYSAVTFVFCWGIHKLRPETN